MQQGALPFQYAEEKNSTGMTALAGLATYLDLFQVADLRGSVGRHVGLREGGQGWTDSQMVTSLILLNLAGESRWRTSVYWRKTRVWVGC